MGLFGDVGNFVGGVIDGTADTAGSAAEGVADAVGLDGAGDAVNDTLDDAGDTVKDGLTDTGQGVDEALGSLPDAVGDTVQEGGEIVGEAIGSAIGYVVGGAEETLRKIAGAFTWLGNNVDVIPVDEISGTLETIFTGIGSLFSFLADLVGFFNSYAAFLHSRSGGESIALLVGTLLMILALYYTITVIASGQILAFPFYIGTLFNLAMLWWFGLGLTLYSVSNVIGAGMIAGSGITLAFIGQAAAEDEMVPIGLVTTVIAVPVFMNTIGQPYSIGVIVLGGVLLAILRVEQLGEVA